jgi:hypothetical protein
MMHKPFALKFRGRSLFGLRLNIAACDPATPQNKQSPDKKPRIFFMTISPKHI